MSTRSRSPSDCDSEDDDGNAIAPSSVQTQTPPSFPHLPLSHVAILGYMDDALNLITDCLVSGREPGTSKGRFSGRTGAARLRSHLEAGQKFFFSCPAGDEGSIDFNSVKFFLVCVSPPSSLDLTSPDSTLAAIRTQAQYAVVSIRPDADQFRCAVVRSTAGGHAPLAASFTLGLNQLHLVELLTPAGAAFFIPTAPPLAPYPPLEIPILGGSVGQPSGAGVAQTQGAPVLTGAAVQALIDAAVLKERLALSATHAAELASLRLSFNNPSTHHIHFSPVQNPPHPLQSTTAPPPFPQLTVRQGPSETARKDARMVDALRGIVPQDFFDALFVPLDYDLHKHLPTSYDMNLAVQMYRDHLRLVEQSKVVAQYSASHLKAALLWLFDAAEGTSLAAFANVPKIESAVQFQAAFRILQGGCGRSYGPQLHTALLNFWNQLNDLIYTRPQLGIDSIVYFAETKLGRVRLLGPTILRDPTSTILADTLCISTIDPLYMKRTEEMLWGSDQPPLKRGRTDEAATATAVVTPPKQRIKMPRLVGPNPCFLWVKSKQPCTGPVCHNPRGAFAHAFDPRDVASEGAFRDWVRLYVN